VRDLRHCDSGSWFAHVQKGNRKIPDECTLIAL
jgi:hypothetical protein